MITLFKNQLIYSIGRLEQWIEGQKYRGYEPFDGLLSFLKPLTFSNLFAERLLLQLVRQSPINLRPLLGIKPQESTKGRGYMALGYLNMLKSTGNQQYKDKASQCLEWLDKNKAPRYEKHCWGNHFEFSGRAARLPKHEPIIVWTSLIGQAFLDAYEILKDEKYIMISKSICDWILALPRTHTDTGTCLSYLATAGSSIHNSNMLGAAMLARTAKLTGNQNLLQIAKDAMTYSCTRQLSNGAWYYGETPNQRWIDNFHTGYNLDSLKCYIDNTGDKTFEKNLRLGFQFYIEHFFEESGRPKYYHNRVYPVDSQCISQSIDTLAYFADEEEAALPLAKKVAKWAIDNMQDKDGHFYYRQYPLIKAKTPMMHWAQATTYKALTLLLSRL